MTRRIRPPAPRLPDDPVAIYDLWRAGHIKRVPNGFWQEPDNARAVMEELWRREGITPEAAPQRCRLAWFRARLGTLLRLHRHSPSLLLMTLYPDRYQHVDFPEFPKADDLQERAFATAGLERDANPMRRWALSQRLRSDRQGKCRLCGRPRTDGTYLCHQHLAQKRERERQRYADWRAQDLCYRCGSRPAVKAGACLPCYGRILVTRARQRRRHYWANKARGLCGHWRCNSPAAPGHVYCQEHVAAGRERYYRLDYAAKARQYRAAKRQKDPE